MLPFATSSKILYVFYPKWVHYPAEPAHNLQNQEIVWFLHYNVIHSPTSLSAIVQLYEYIFSSHPFPHLFFFFLSVAEIFSYLDKLDGFKADMVNMGSGWAFLYGFFSLKMVLMFIHAVTCMNPAFFFFPIVIKNK